MTNDEIIELIKSRFPKLHGDLGKAPSIRELARNLGVRAGHLRAALADIQTAVQGGDSSKLDPSIRKMLRMGEARMRDLEQILLLDEDENEIGVFSIRNAFELAEKRDLVLFFVDPIHEPPIAQLLEHGKHKYLQGRASRERMRKNKGAVKEIKIREAIQEGDLHTKVSHVQKQLSRGHNVRLIVELIEPTDIARATELVTRITICLADTAKIVEGPDLENGFLTALFTMQLQTVEDDNTPAPV